MEDYTEQLKKMREDMAMEDVVRTRLSELDHSIPGLKEKVTQLKETLEKEQNDVDKLEKQGLARFLADTFGHLEEKLEKEQREAAQAAFAYDTALKQLESAQKEQKEQFDRILVIEAAKQNYQTLLDKQSALLQQSDSHSELDTLETELVAATKRYQDLRELVLAAEAVLGYGNRLNESIQSARRAGNWGYGGITDPIGMLSDYAKWQEMETVKDDILTFQKAIEHFNQKLPETTETLPFELQLQFGKWDKFGDLFLDDLLLDFFDIKVFSKMVAVSQQVDEITETAADMKLNLEAELEKAEADLKTLQLQRENLILD